MKNILALLLATTVSMGLVQTGTKQDKATRDGQADILNFIDSQAEHFGEVSRKIWEFAELGYKENVLSNDTLNDLLDRNL